MIRYELKVLIKLSVLVSMRKPPFMKKVYISIEGYNSSMLVKHTTVVTTCSEACGIILNCRQK